MMKNENIIRNFDLKFETYVFPTSLQSKLKCGKRTHPFFLWKAKNWLEIVRSCTRFSIISRPHRSEAAASAPRKRWRADTDEPLSHTDTTATRFLNKNRRGASKSRTGTIYLELHQGFSVTDTIMANAGHLITRSAIVNSTSGNFTDRSVNQPNEREVAKAEIAIALLRGPEFLRICYEAREPEIWVRIKRRAAESTTVRGYGRYWRGCSRRRRPSERRMAVLRFVWISDRNLGLKRFFVKIIPMGFISSRRKSPPQYWFSNLTAIIALRENGSSA